MKKNFALIFTFFTTSLMYSEPPLCISLGSFCAPAIHLRVLDPLQDSVKTLHIRENAYPFDWIISSFDALYACLNDDFNKFLYDLHQRQGLEIVDYYGFVFIHDWPTTQSGSFDILNNDSGVNNAHLIANWNDYTPLVKEKYARRIERFKEACSGSDKVYFIRYHGITKKQAIMLRDLLQKKYKNLEFELIVISDDKTSWNLDKIKNFYMHLHDWGKLDLWTTIFDQVGLEYSR